MDDADDLGQAVAGFRRAEAALAAIATSADRLVDARSEVEQARDELKVVAGALVGLATAHRELVGQLGEAASALRPAERWDDERFAVALREAEVVRSRQVSEVADAVEELAHRLDRALAERIGGVVAELSETVAGLATTTDMARLDDLASTEDVLAMERRLVEYLTPAPSVPPPAPDPEVAARAATSAARAVETQVAQLIEQVHAGQRRVHQMVLAMAVAFLVFAGLVSVLALR